MSASSEKKTLVILLFAFVGLPAGLVSLYLAPTIISMLRDSDPQAQALGVLFAAPVLVAFLAFAGLLVWLIITWTRRSA